MTCEGCSGAVSRILNKLGGEVEAEQKKSVFLFVVTSLFESCCINLGGFKSVEDKHFFFFY